MTVIVVGVDGSDTAMKAARSAAELANKLGARLHVVTAFDRSSGVRVEGSPEVQAPSIPIRAGLITCWRYRKS